MSKSRMDALERSLRECDAKAGNALSVAHEAGRMVCKLDERVARLLAGQAAEVIASADVDRLQALKPGILRRVRPDVLAFE